MNYPRIFALKAINEFQSWFEWKKHSTLHKLIEEEHMGDVNKGKDGSSRINLDSPEEVHKPPEMTVCPECLKRISVQEKAMFNGFCENCREETPGDYD